MVLPGSEREFPLNDQFGVESNDSKIFPQLYFSSRDAFGKPVGQQKVWILRRTAQNFNFKPNERGMALFETRIRRLASQLAFPHTIAVRAIYLYRRVKAVQLFKKPGLNDWALAFLLVACRETRYITTFEDLVNPNGLVSKESKQRSIRKVKEYYNKIARDLKLHIERPSIENYITYFAGKLRVEGSLINNAIRLSKTHTALNSAPHCVAAAALFISMRDMGNSISQKEFCDNVNLSEISLRRWVRMFGGYDESPNSTPGVVDVVDHPSDNIVDRSARTEDFLGGPKRDHKNRYSENRPQDRSEYPPTPRKTERDEHNADDRHPSKNRRVGSKEIRHAGKIRFHPRRISKLAKKRTKAH